jgi:hypothetical protein
MRNVPAGPLRRSAGMLRPVFLLGGFVTAKQQQENRGLTPLVPNF